jgi:hypothetical protein
MATRRTTKKSKKSKKKPAKRSTKKLVSRKSQPTESLHECGDFDAHAEGDTLYITITGDTAFDAEVVIQGHACRSVLLCRIVNGHWVCD